ncbi:MAG: polyhydroxyalkanoate synthesis regulator [Thermodesulfobacteriota bacterium]
MIELIKKIMFTSVGLASLTKDKIEELGKELIEKGKLSEKEGKEFLDELLKKSEGAQKEMEARTDKLVKESLKKLNLASRDDLVKLEKQLKKLAKTVKNMEIKK